MAFLVYLRHFDEGKEVLKATGEHFSLAGYNLIYNAWEKKGKPIRQGWHVTADDLVRLYSSEKCTYDDMRLLIDYKPNSKEHIALIELLEIYLFTWDGASINEVGWTVMMLRGRDVLDKWPEEEVTPEIKKNYIDLIDNPNYSSGDFVEFLYLQGDKWSWGRNGSTNAVFLHGETREYFRKYF